MPTQEYHSSHYDLPSDGGASLERNDSVHDPVTKTHATTVVDDLLTQRFSCRYFLPHKIPDTDTIKAILDAARYAPSGSNFQPWKVHVLRGMQKSRVSEHVRNAHEKEAEMYSPPFEFYPDTHALEQSTYDHLARRRKDFGRQFYGPLGIDRGDVEARKQITRRNWTFFDAPIGLLITTVDITVAGTYLDVGFFAMSLIIAARAHGLEACVQEAHATFHDVYAKHLSLDDQNETVVCGIALGYADMDRVRKFSGRQNRMGMEELVVFHDEVETEKSKG